MAASGAVDLDERGRQIETLKDLSRVFVCRQRQKGDVNASLGLT